MGKEEILRDGGMKEITFLESLKLLLRCNVMAKRRDTGTEICDKHLYEGLTTKDT
jgi:hypothetical protein